VDCFRGDFVSSKRHVEYALEKLEPVEETGSTPQFSEDPYVASLSVYAVDLMALGFPDQALKQARLAVELARGLNNPIALALSLTWISIIYGNISQFEQLKITAEELIELCKKYNFVYWLSGGLHSLGLALGHLGEGEKGVNLLSEAMAMVNDTDVRVSFGIMNSMRAEIMARHGRVADAYQIIQQEADTARQKGEGFFIPEILRIQAETLMLMKSPQMRLAEEIFLESIQMARAQQARFFELKSALGLANLWASQNMSRQARLLLSDILNQMTEGFEVPVVKAAIQFISNLS
jgi:tetratricopeptide (TPR) repeat protein